MDPLQSLIQAIIVIVILFALALVMRRLGILAEEHSQILARVVTDLFLPAIVFVTLANREVHLSQLGPALLMLGLELTAIALAWSASIVLRFDRAHQGAIVFCAAFGSSTFLGYSLITQMYPHDAEAMTEAVLISEIGVGYTIFILGPVLAAYFGSQELDARSRWAAAVGFFKSPVFFALVIGLLWGALRLPGENNLFLAPVFRAGHVLAAALTPVAILSIGLMFKVPAVRTILVPLGIVILIKLLLKPLAAGFVASQIGFPEEWTDVLVILAAMPPAILGPIFLKRYGGDASIAPALLLAATIVSGVTLAMVFSLVAGT
jgi:predicted permease